MNNTLMKILFAILVIWVILTNILFLCLETPPALYSIASLVTACIVGIFFFCRKTDGKPTGQNAPKEKQLIETSRLASVGEMAPGIAHEISQPLCVVRGYLELMSIYLKDSPELKEKNIDDVFPLCLKSVDHAVEIIQAMANYSRSRNTEVKTAEAELCLRKAFSFFSEQYRQHNISVRWQIPENLPPVAMSPICLEQIGIILFSNARYALDKKGEAIPDIRKILDMKLSYKQAENRVYLKCIDNGTGMDAKTLESCTEPFFTTKGNEGGTGLGVPVIRMIAENEGGTFNIKSTEGEGAMFTISFPAAAQNSNNEEK